MRPNTHLYAMAINLDTIDYYASINDKLYNICNTISSICIQTKHPFSMDQLDLLKSNIPTGESHLNLIYHVSKRCMKYAQRVCNYGSGYDTESYMEYKKLSYTLYMSTNQRLADISDRADLTIRLPGN